MAKREYVTRQHAARLAFCNSARLLGPVEIDGRHMRWVGIGWVDEGPATGRERIVVKEDQHSPIPPCSARTQGGKQCSRKGRYRSRGKRVCKQHE